MSARVPLVLFLAAALAAGAPVAAADGAPGVRLAQSDPSWPRLKSRTRGEPDGRAFLEDCGGADDGEREACRNPILNEVFNLQANQSRSPNPFSRCPVDISRVSDMERLGKGLHKAFVAWLRANPDRQSEPVPTLAKDSLADIDVCRLED